ncbi:FAD-binding domain-containing protein [Backusella circina FSU 941]|nr:FAD-binding domain-containing protein [Backusella circina FSU 941]
MSMASRVRFASRRLLFNTRVAVPTVPRVLPVFNSARLYATKKSEAAYTVDKFPGYVRNNDFKQLSKEDVEHFKSIVGEQGLIYDNEDDLIGFNTDWMGKFRGKSQLVLKPKTTQQVSDIMKYCNQQKLAVVPQGGNTGLVGGSVPVFDEVVLSLQGMNNIRGFDEVSGILTADAGCILESLDNWLGEKGYRMPIDLGAKGSCHIGGNIATNAGGLRLLRYGSLHGTVLGLEVVLPDGTIVDNMSTLRKDNTGYDLKQLFIGSEGTIGVITGVSILTPQRANAVNVALLGLNSFESVQEAFKKSRVELSEILSAFEFWDGSALQMFKKHGSPKPIMEKEYPFYVLIETSGSNKDHDDEKLSTYLENMIVDEVAEDGVVAQDESQIRTLWSVREGFTEALGKEPAVYKYDVSIPVPKLYQCVEDMREHLRQGGVFGKEDSPVIDVFGFGHVGDGNLHLNIPANRLDPRVIELIEPFLYEWVSQHQGSISAEHGLGIAKNKALSYSKSPIMIEMMKAMKEHFDPNGILNPYKYLPAK